MGQDRELRELRLLPVDLRPSLDQLVRQLHIVEVSREHREDGIDHVSKTDRTIELVDGNRRHSNLPS